MSFRVGDAAFGANGIPGVVKRQDNITGNLLVDTDQKTTRSIHRHGYINGLTPQERQNFNEHLDAVRSESDPNKKLELIREKISELKLDSANFRMVKYLESEMFHLMNTYNISPRLYNLENP